MPINDQQAIPNYDIYGINISTIKIDPNKVGNSTMNLAASNNSVSISNTGNQLVIHDVSNNNELQSDEEIPVKDGHTFNAIMRLYGTTLILEYKCECCDVVLHRQVISKVPKSIIKEKCLSKIVRETK